MPWGYHLVLDAYRCNKEKVNDPDHIKAFVKELVKEIDMKAYGEPWLESFANDDPEKGGYTLIQLIETSNISAHFVAATGDAYFDIFSCKAYNHDVAINLIKKWFNPYTVGFRFIERQAKSGKNEYHH